MIDSYFEYLSSVMTEEAAALGECYSKHRGELGRNREFVLRRMLKHLPNKFVLGTGFVLFESETSTQQEIVI